MNDTSAVAFASTLPPPAPSPLEVDAVLDVTLGAELAPPVKVCGCGRAHDAASWSALPLCGVQDDGEAEPYELRNCPCGSTLAVPLCAVVGCGAPATWTAEPSLRGYCEAHVDEWLRAEASFR